MRKIEPDGEVGLWAWTVDGKYRLDPTLIDTFDILNLPLDQGSPYTRFAIHCAIVPCIP